MATRKTLGPAVRVAIAALILYLLVSAGAIDWRALLGLGEAWRLTLIATLLMISALTLIAWRLCMLLEPSGFHLPISSSIRLTLIGNFFNLVLPGAGGGDLVRIYYAARGNDGRRTEVATIVLLDRVGGLLAMAIWPLLACPFFLGFIADRPALYPVLGTAAAFVGAVIGGLALFSSPRLANGSWISNLLAKIPLGWHIRRMLFVLGQYRYYRGPLVKAVGVSLIAHTLTISAISFLAAGILGQTSLVLVLVIPLGLLINAIPLTPGGLGVGEVAFDGLFRAAGMDGGAEVLLGWRFVMLLIGIPGLALYIQGHRRFVHAIHEETLPDPTLKAS